MKNVIQKIFKKGAECAVKIEIKNYLKDHRIFMMSMIAALSIGGNWKLHDPDSIRTSFPSFLNLIKKIQKSPK